MNSLNAIYHSTEFVWVWNCLRMKKHNLPAPKLTAFDISRAVPFVSVEDPDQYLSGLVWWELSISISYECGCLILQ